MFPSLCWPYFLLIVLKKEKLYPHPPRKFFGKIEGSADQPKYTADQCPRHTSYCPQSRASAKRNNYNQYYQKKNTSF